MGKKKGAKKGGTDKAEPTTPVEDADTASATSVTNDSVAAPPAAAPPASAATVAMREILVEWVNRTAEDAGVPSEKAVSALAELSDGVLLGRVLSHMHPSCDGLGGIVSGGRSGRVDNWALKQANLDDVVAAVEKVLKTLSKSVIELELNLAAAVSTEAIAERTCEDSLATLVLCIAASTAVSPAKGDLLGSLEFSSAADVFELATEELPKRVPGLPRLSVREHFTAIEYSTPCPPSASKARHAPNNVAVLLADTEMRTQADYEERIAALTESLKELSAENTMLKISAATAAAAASDAAAEDAHPTDAEETGSPGDASEVLSPLSATFSPRVRYDAIRSEMTEKDETIAHLERRAKAAEADAAALREEADIVRAELEEQRADARLLPGLRDARSERDALRTRLAAEEERRQAAERRVDAEVQEVIRAVREKERAQAELRAAEAKQAQAEQEAAELRVVVGEADAAGRTEGTLREELLQQKLALAEEKARHAALRAEHLELHKKMRASQTEDLEGRLQQRLEMRRVEMEPWRDYIHGLAAEYQKFKAEALCDYAAPQEGLGDVSLSATCVARMPSVSAREASVPSYPPPSARRLSTKPTAAAASAAAARRMSEMPTPRDLLMGTPRGGARSSLGVVP